ncbi:Harbinger transposase-derived nuclease domain, partial [Arabidopsis suecica]
IREKTSLRGTRQTCLEEMVATFLLTIGQNSRYNYTMDTFERSKFAASTNFHKVLNALTTIAPSLMAKPGLTVPAKIRESTRYYPYFKDCVGAIDGTHIHAMVPASNAPSYRNRKGYTSQNVLAACNFDLEFIYVLSGWEGTAHDSKVFSDALTRSKSKLPVPEGKYYLVDCGFANRRNFLAPFRGTKYHLQDFRGQGCDPSNQNELFNLRHASLRNVIERIFGIFKSRFLIFKSAPPFPFKVQAELVLACAGLHNFLRRECRSDEFLPEEYSDNDEENNESHEENNYEENGDTRPLQSQQREYANNWRDTIAASMWAEATGTGSIP